MTLVHIFYIKYLLEIIFVKITGSFSKISYEFQEKFDDVSMLFFDMPTRSVTLLFTFSIWLLFFRTKFALYQLFQLIQGKLLDRFIVLVC